MKDYAGTLKGIIEQNKIELIRKVRGSGKKYHLLENKRDLIFNTINKMLDEQEPLFTMYIARTLAPVLEIEEHGDLNSFSSWINRFVRYTYESKYGIKQISLKDAVIKVYGDYFRLVDLNKELSIRPPYKLLFKSEGKLFDYIKEHTNKGKVKDLENIVIKHNFSIFKP